MDSDRDLIPGSRFLQSHLLIEPVAALLEREETGYRDLRKALVSVSLIIRHRPLFLGRCGFLVLAIPVLDNVAHNPTLQQRTVITTYYQETLDTRDIDLQEYLASAKAGGRPFVVFILQCSPEENIKRLVGRSSNSKSRLSDADILTDIRQNHYIYSFLEQGYSSPDVWEYRLDNENLRPEEAAHQALKALEDGSGAGDR